MGFRNMFNATTTPVAIDFGSATVSMLQLSLENTPEVVASHELVIPDDARNDHGHRFEFLADVLPRALSQGNFVGRRVVCAPPSSQFTVQQVQVQAGGPVSVHDQVCGEVAHRLGRPSGSIVARSYDMPSSSGRNERLCLAIARDDVMQYVDLCKTFKMDVVGVHADHTAILNAFKSVNRRLGDESFVTMYVDVGWSSVNVVLGQGQRMVLARIVHLGGRQIDLAAAEAWSVSPEEARARRWREEPAVVVAAEKLVAVAAVHGNGPSEERRGDTRSPSLGSEVSICESIPAVREIHETIADELSMCARFAQAAVAGNTIHRLVLLGGESRSGSLAARLSNAVGVEALVGDPIKRFEAQLPFADGDAVSCRPQWAVACGLCSSPVEL